MKKTSDNVLAAVKAGLNAVPFVGGSIASLLGDYLPSSTQKNIEKSMELLGGQLPRLGDRVDCETVDRDEFAE